MLILGSDPHKRTHTIVAVDDRWRNERSTPRPLTTLSAVAWAETFGDERVWAVEHCRHHSRRFERDLLKSGERLVTVPTKIMAITRKAAGM